GTPKGPKGGQLAGIARLKEQTKRSKHHATPEMKFRYRERAAQLNKPYMAVQVADYMNAPEITAVFLAGYTGQPGEPILIHAHDDFEVKSLTVVIRLANGEVLE